MHFENSRPRKKKNMDIGRPSFEKTPGTHKIMDIPNPSCKNTVSTTDFYSDVAFRGQKVTPENIGIGKCILDIQDPGKNKNMDTGRPSFEKTPGTHKIMDIPNPRFGP